MDFYGLMKMTLLDYPGQVACTVFTGGCNYRCNFCHNALLVTELDNSTIIREEEILSYLKKRQGLLDGICISGGEPLMNENIGLFIEKAKELGYKIKLDTNGSYPERLKALVNQGLIDHVAMDIKNCPDKYGLTIGIPDYDIRMVEESKNFLIKSGISCEFRTTIVKEYHEPEDIEKLTEWIKGARQYFLQGFIDSGNLIGKNLHTHSREMMNEMLKTARKVIPEAKLRGV